MKKIILNVFLLVLLSLPNIIVFISDSSLTKFAGILVPVIFFIGIGSLANSFKNRLYWALPLLLLSFISIVILVQFNLQITEGVIEAVLNTDPSEAYEFVTGVNIYLYWLLLFYLISIFYLFKNTGFLIDNVRGKKKYLYRFILLLMISLPVLDMLGKGASAYSYPLGLARSSYLYVQEKAVIKKLVEGRKNFYFNASLNGVDDETFVFVIGESSRRDYYSLYGYYRDTSPRLSKVKDLVLFQNAVSPSNTTIKSLRSVLHLSTVDDTSLFYTTKSIVSLAKEAGYKTWWLSAQSRFGKYETDISSSSIGSDVKTFLSQGRTFVRSYDDDLLPLLMKGLDDPANNKFIVMHLYGSHMTYKSRYPKEYSLFHDVPLGYENHSQETQRKVNEYANSIAFTDHVLSEVINKLKEKNKITCMVYISDHAEYLADELGFTFMGHGGEPPHKVEVEVPLIVWCSEGYKKKYADKWQGIVNNKLSLINTQDMFYSLSDLMHIDYKLMEQYRSFFNKKFKPELPRKTISASTGKIVNYKDLK